MAWTKTAVDDDDDNDNNNNNNNNNDVTVLSATLFVWLRIVCCMEQRTVKDVEVGGSLKYPAFAGGTELKHENRIPLYTIICVQAESLITPRAQVRSYRRAA